MSEERHLPMERAGARRPSCLPELHVTDTSGAGCCDMPPAMPAQDTKTSFENAEPILRVADMAVSLCSNSDPRIASIVEYRSRNENLSRHSSSSGPSHFLACADSTAVRSLGG